jgi:transposase
LAAHQKLTVEIRRCDKMIDTIGRKKYPQTQKLRQIKGVGPITSLAFVLTIGDPHRFRKSRDIGPYLGLTPKRDQSGAVDKPLGITKAGNPMMRKLLVNAANYIMGPFGEDCDLQRTGNRIAARGEKIARRKAKVAVARKLGVLMHQLLLCEDDYQPLRNQPKANAA